MKEITMLIPQYIKDFKCIGAECEDTCCAGWRVSIDEETYKKYKKMSNNEMSKKLNKYVGRDRTHKGKYDIAKIRLQNDKCPFLKEDRLCEIHGNLGEEYLSNTCAIYPRLNYRVDGVMEQSLTLSCPEAARVMLLNKEPMQFDQGERQFTTRDLGIESIQTTNATNKWQNYFWDMRIFNISLLQNRRYTLDERLFILGLATRDLDQVIEKKKYEEIPSILEKYNRNMECDLYQNILQDIPAVNEMQLKFCKELLDIRYSKSIGTERYRKCLLEVLLGLKFNDGVILEEGGQAYKKAYEQYYAPFFEEHSYILENYLVNYSFSNRTPIDQKTPFESYVCMIIHYAIIKIHLIGQANYHNGLEVDRVIDTIQTVVKTFEHNKAYFKQILDLVEKNNYMDLAYMAILIKN